VEHARRATDVQPESAEAHLALAIALGRQALKEDPRTRPAMAREVKAQVDRTLELDPTTVLHWLELGRACMDLDRRTEARDALEKAIALPPTSSPRDAVYQREPANC
jgi:Flp pilus assembly protein TadD